ncbi:MAG: preprotein translocase subunit YajC, partial [Oscillospiraceae bacterium]
MYFLLSTGTPAPSMSAVLVQTVLPFAIVLAVMYFMLIAPQKKREKKLQDIRNSLEIGDGV